MMVLRQCSGNDAFNTLAKIEQNLSPAEIIKHGELIMTQGSKMEVIKEIIKIIEYYLKIVGKELERFQIQVLAGDLYKKFRTDTLEDIILFFMMIRNEELGKIGYYDTFRDKIIAYVEPFMQYKSEQREKLIKIKNRKFKTSNETMSEEAYAKFTELQKLIKNPVQKRSETFSINSILKSVDNYLEHLPENCKKLSDSDLKFEIRRTEYNNKAAYEILLQEQQRRIEEKKDARGNRKRKNNKDEN